MDLFHRLETVLSALENNEFNVITFLCELLRSDEPRHIDAISPFTTSQGFTQLFDALSVNELAYKPLLKAIRTFLLPIYNKEMVQVTASAAGYHFNAKNMSAERIANFSCAKMGKDLQVRAPLVWELFGVLINEPTGKDADGDVNMALSTESTGVIDTEDEEDDEDTVPLGPLVDVDNGYEGSDGPNAAAPLRGPEWTHNNDIPRDIPEDPDSSGADEWEDIENEIDEDNTPQVRSKKAQKRREVLFVVVRTYFGFRLDIADSDL